MTDTTLVEVGTAIMGIVLFCGPIAILAYFVIRATEALSGGKAKFDFYPHSGNYVICQNCGASTVHRYTKEEVAKKWNQRK